MNGLWKPLETVWHFENPLTRTLAAVSDNLWCLYTVKKAQWNFQLENHVTFHLIGIKIVCNVKIIYISTDIKLNSIEFIGFYIVHNVIQTNFTLYIVG
jgi:hypothetical protein